MEASVIKYAALSITKDGENVLIVQRVHIIQTVPKGICGSRIHYGSAKEPKSATCHLKPGHLYNPDHRYKEDRHPSMLIAKQAVMRKFKGQRPRWIGWYDSYQPLYNGQDVELIHDGRKYVGR